MRILREPALHFFVLGALLFGAHHLLFGDAQRIAVTPGLQADLRRRFQDDTGRAPTVAEQAKLLRDWQRDEALFRQALAEKLDKNDRAIRTILIDKLRARALSEAPLHEPTEAELAAWLAQHRNLYETPLRYELEWLSFGKEQPSAPAERAAIEEKLRRGSEPRTLERPLFGAKLTRDEATERLGGALATALAALPLGQWQEHESPSELLLLRVNHVEGGLLPPSELRARLVLDCSVALREQAASLALDKIAQRYRFEVAP